LRSTGFESFFAPFRVRSYRFQWPADLLTSWAFEMETIVLGWYVFVQTDSVLLLTAYGSLQFLGTLIAPMMGVLGDKLGRRTMLCAMRAFYATMATVVMTLAVFDLLTPYYVFAVAALVGLVRPSDLVMRNALIGDTIPIERLGNALGLTRTTSDSARVAGALAGAGLFSVLGIGATFIFVVAFYIASFLLTFGVSAVRPHDDRSGDAGESSEPTTHPSHWQELKQGLVYVWNTPKVRAVMWLAFMVNLTAYPFSHGLLPYVAKTLYSLDENGLGQLVAAYASGALIGSLIVAWTGGFRRPARFMLINMLLWYSLLLVFGQLQTQATGMLVLLMIGIVQGSAMVSMSITLLSTVTARFRGRVMGVRTLAIYGLPLGLMAAGALVDLIGYSATVTTYSVVGLFCTAMIGIRWRGSIWR
jgi:MFS family permease